MGLVGERSRHGRRDGRRRGGVEPREVGQQLHEGGVVRGDGGRAGGERLDHGEPESLAQRGADDEVGGLVERDQHVLADEAGAQQPAAEPEPLGGHLEVVAVEGRERAGDDELVPIAHARRQQRPRVEQPLDVLPPVAPAGVEHVADAEPRHAGLGGAPRVGARRRWPEGAGGHEGDGGDPVGGDAQSPLHVVGDVAGDGEHAVGRAHELEPRPVAATLARVAEVDVGHRFGDQVEHGRDDAHPGVARRRRQQAGEGDRELDGRGEVHDRAGAVDVRLVDEPHLPTGHEGLDRRREREVGVEEERLDRAGHQALEGAGELDDVARDAAVAVVDALRSLEVVEHG
jgi:hypothetical protein